MKSCETKNLPIKDIKVSERIRQELGDIEELASDISAKGLINPVTVMEVVSGEYRLIAGLRRLEACKKLGYTSVRASVVSPLEADELLNMEYAENMQRKDFTLTERLVYADKIKAVEQEKARRRKSEYARGGYKSEASANREEDRVVRPYPEETRYPCEGRANDVIAKKAGFTSRRQYERAEEVAAERPDLLPEIDAKKTTIYGAYKEITANRKDVECEKNDVTVKPPAVDKVATARHDRLMKNPLYAGLHKKIKEVEADRNRAEAELDRRRIFYDNQVKHFQSNIEALKMQCARLEAENAALRGKTEGEVHENE